uniref:Cystatin domain-containing protein n=1 Tax=Strongyloides venezuelensis TaxID=75913 RepID=A0A0K0G4E5_STRVS
MNYLKIVILVAVAILLIIEASFVKDFSALGNGWKYKDTNHSTVVKLANESVSKFNEEHHKNYSFAGVESAKKGKETTPHYKLEILATTPCGKSNETCPKLLLSDVRGNPKNKSGLEINVEEDLNYYPYHLNVF